MISLKVIDTDLFTDMPITSRLLYFELCMRADDDGFVSSPKKIMRLSGCSDDDMKILMTKKFIIPFESGICVIRHWRIHNYIRSDRYQETEYLQEKSSLVEINKKYEISDVIPNVIPNVIPMVTTGEVRLGKVSLGEVNISIIIKHFQQQIGSMVTQPQVEEILSYLEILDEELVKHAIDIAADNNKRSFSYIKAILKSWVASNIKTKQEAIAESEAIKNKNKQPKSTNKFVNYKQRQYDTVALEKKALQMRLERQKENNHENN